MQTAITRAFSVATQPPQNCISLLSSISLQGRSPSEPYVAVKLCFPLVAGYHFFKHHVIYRPLVYTRKLGVLHMLAIVAPAAKDLLQESVGLQAFRTHLLTSW